LTAHAQINLPHTSISRRHARIFLEDGGFYIEDLGAPHSREPPTWPSLTDAALSTRVAGSTHGTFAAGARLSGPTRLFDGLRIAFGSSTFELVPSNMMAVYWLRIGVKGALVVYPNDG
jgi:pSer/pThr/pTyr-binding forkhead associated (FHA) protein